MSLAPYRAMASRTGAGRPEAAAFAAEACGALLAGPLRSNAELDLKNAAVCASIPKARGFDASRSNRRMEPGAEKRSPADRATSRIGRLNNQIPNSVA